MPIASAVHLTTLQCRRVPWAPLEASSHFPDSDWLRESASREPASTSLHRSQRGSICAPAQTFSATQRRSRRKEPTSASISGIRVGHAALDWFPFGGHFRLSPLVVLGNNNRILATAIIPSASTVTLNGQDDISSYSDPLRGSGRIDFRKVSPGVSFGFGNLIPRNRSHFSVPVEMGFYYAGPAQTSGEFHRQRLRSQLFSFGRLPVGRSGCRLPAKSGCVPSA